MKGDSQVRFREKLGVRFLWLTRLPGAEGNLRLYGDSERIIKFLKVGKIVDFLKNFLTEEILKEYNLKIQIKSKGLAKRIALTTTKSVSEKDLGNLHIGTEDILKYNEIIYWIELIEYDLLSIHNSLIYIDYKNKIDNITITNSVLDIADISFFFDSAVSKLFSAIDRIAQLINCTNSLGLVEDKLGTNGVSLINVRNKIKQQGNLLLEGYINKLINVEIKNLKIIRNGIAHNFHPLNKDVLYKQEIKNDEIHILKVNKFELENKDLISSLQKGFLLVDSVLLELIQLIAHYYRIEGYLIKDKEIKEIIYFKLKV